jgi:transcription initiation factor TFIID TATA-box-binding protein
VAVHVTALGTGHRVLVGRPGSLKLGQRSSAYNVPDPSGPRTSTRVVNVVASTRLSRPVSLQLVSRWLTGSTYNAEAFPGLIYHRKDPKCTIILFANGKMVSTGTTSERSSREALQTTLLEICAAEAKPARLGEVLTVNLVMTSDMGAPLDLARIHADAPEATYEPEQFPGLVIHFSDNRALLLFGSGKVVCAGAKSESSARETVRDLRRWLGTRGLLKASLST